CSPRASPSAGCRRRSRRWPGSRSTSRTSAGSSSSRSSSRRPGRSTPPPAAARPSSSASAAPSSTSARPWGPSCPSPGPGRRIALHRRGGEDRRVSQTSSRRLRAALVVPLLVLLGLVAGPAAAEPPFYLEGPVTDEAGVLDGGEVGDIEDAVTELQEERGVDLFVVYVDTFDGMDRESWAQETISTSDLGTDDVLLAVAVEDRNYCLCGDTTTISEEGLQSVSTQDVEPELRQDNWAEAAVAAA